MASIYGAITVANLEAFTKLDYSGIDASLTDAAIEDMAIDPAEVLCESHTGTAPSSSSSNPVLYGIMTVAAWKMEAWMEREGINPNSPMKFDNLYDMYGCTAILDVINMWEKQRNTSNNRRSLWVGT